MSDVMSDMGGAWEPGEGSESIAMEALMDELKDKGKHGIVISSAVAWIAVQLEMNAEGVWMEIAEQCWNPGEASKAKKALKDACGENLKELKGFNSDRRNKEKELGDIKDALKYLKDKKKMPLVLADVVMMRRAPQPGFYANKVNNEDIMERVDILEKAMTGFMSKTEKYMEEGKEQVEKLAETVTKNQSKSPRLPQIHLSKPPTPIAKKRRFEETPVFGQPPAALPTVQQQYSSVVAGVTALSSEQQEQIRSMQQLFNSQQQQKQQQPARQRNICYGTAKPTGGSSQAMLAADVSGDS